MDNRADALAAKGYRVEDHVVSPSEKPEPGEPVPGWGRHLWKLWRYRLSYALRQTQLGVNVFLVDVDTMWNRHVPLRDLFDSRWASAMITVVGARPWREMRREFASPMGAVAFAARSRSDAAAAGRTRVRGSSRATPTRWRSTVDASIRQLSASSLTLSSAGCA